jgi:Rrf2 family protein
MPSLTDLAERHGVPADELETILGALSSKGILQVRSDPAPGYFLLKPAGEIKIGQVLRALDHPVAAAECQDSSLSRPCQECKTPQSCQLRLSIAQICETITKQLDRTSLADFLLQPGDLVASCTGRNAEPHRIDT